MVTAEDVKNLHIDSVGFEATQSVPERCYKAAAHYANMNGFDPHSGTQSDDAILFVLTVFMKINAGEFHEFEQGGFCTGEVHSVRDGKVVPPLLHEDGNGQFEYCNASEMHVKDNPTHTVITQYVTWNGITSLEVRCLHQELDPAGQPGPHWWDHVGA